MILKNLKVFLQNVQKNKILTDTVLEINKNFDIILIQKPPQLIICSIPSSTSKESKVIVEAPNYSNWVTFSRLPSNDNDFL